MARRSAKRNATSGAKAPSRSAPSFWRGDGFWGFLLVAAVALVYQPVWSAGYMWDDDLILTQNPAIIGPLGLKEIWTTQAADICPLALTTLWFEHALWGLAPLPYHLVTVGFHAAGAVVLWRVLLALRLPGAWLGAALWALHPVQVESVAWISEIKNTQSGLFYLLAVLFFVRSLRATAPHDFPWAVLFAALAMASKTSTMVLPAVLALCAWWVEGRWNWRQVLQIGPLLLLSLAAALLSVWTQAERANQPEWNRTWPERLATAGDAVWFYLGKLIWPQPLALIYPRWHIDAPSIADFLPLLAVVLVLVVLWLRHDPWSRALTFAFSYFLVALLPVLGLMNYTYSRYSFVADHFQYLASMGPLALAAAGLARGAESFLAGQSRVSSALAAVPLLGLGALAWLRVGVFQDSGTVWADTLAKNPACWEGHAEIGLVLYGNGQSGEAISELRKSIELNPRYFKARYNLASMLQAQGQLAEALDEFKQATLLVPTQVQVRLGYGAALLQANQLDAAVGEIEKAVQLAPDMAQAHFELGVAYTQRGWMDKAAAEYQKAIALDPALAEAHTNLGLIDMQKGRFREGVAQLEEVVRLQPDSADARTNLAHAEAVAQQAGGPAQ